MARRSRDPRSGATIHDMSPDVQMRYERMKSGGVVGWSRAYDPWAISNSTASDPWGGRVRSNPGIWPPDRKDEGQ